MPYQNLKTQVKECAKNIKNISDDKPLINMVINDFLDTLNKSDIEQMLLKNEISEKKAEQYKNWLADYACTLHA